MAEALLKMSAKRGVEVCSAGIKPGKEVNEQAVKAMREIGCDLSGHECRHLSDFSDIKFDYIAKICGVTLTHYRMLEARDWSIDLENLEHQITTKTRAIILISLATGFLLFLYRRHRES